MRRKTLWGRMVKAFARDATPEEVTDLMEMVGGELEDEEGLPQFTDNDEMMEMLRQIVAALGVGGNEPKDSLEELEDELSETAESEESVTVPAEELAEKSATRGDEENEFEDEEEELKAVVDAALLKVLRGVKPAIARLNSTDRKRMSDALGVSVRSAMNRAGMNRTARPRVNGYALLGQAAKSAGSQRARDSRSEQRQLEEARRAYAGCDPHGKK